MSKQSKSRAAFDASQNTKYMAAAWDKEVEKEPGYKILSFKGDKRKDALKAIKQAIKDDEFDLLVNDDGDIVGFFIDNQVELLDKLNDVDSHVELRIDGGFLYISSNFVSEHKEINNLQVAAINAGHHVYVNVNGELELKLT